MKCLTVDAADGLFLASEHFIPTHTTFSLLMEPLRHIHVPDFRAVIFRRTYPLILKPGGIWDDSHKIYSHYPGAEPLLNPPRWTFPSGATVSFQHLEYDQTVYEFKSAQIPLIMWDQLEEFSEHQYWYLFSRNRSMCGVKPYLRATCNPDAESWLAGFLGWWIDQDSGYPIEERAGKIRWMARAGDSIVCGNTAEDVIAKLGPDTLPKSVSFIPSVLDDHPALVRQDPGYRANLQMLTTVERERLLFGNWKIRPQAGLIFPRDLWQFCEAAPNNARWVRYWDKACLAKNAMILTRRGEIPIQSVSSSEFVMTRNGWKRVLWSGRTGRRSDIVTLTTSGRKQLRCTSDHLIWDVSGYWVDTTPIVEYHLVFVFKKAK